VQAEEPAEDDRGEFGGKVHHGGIAGGLGADTEAAEPAHELLGAEVLSGGAAWEQPWASGGAVSGQHTDQRAERRRQLQGRLAEQEGDGPVSRGDLAGADRGDPGEGLGEEQHEQAGGPVGGVRAGVVEETAVTEEKPKDSIRPALTGS